LTRIYASSGGGVRLGATFGAVLEGERQGRFQSDRFGWYVGTSAGALDALLTANGWTGEEKKALFLDTDFRRFFTPLLVPLGVRKMLAVMAPISLKKLAAFIDCLQDPNPYGPPIRQFDGLLINSVDAENNVQTVFCHQTPDWLYPAPKRVRVECWAFNRQTLGAIITRSMVLPGLRADEPRWQDGGVAENPLLSILPKDAAITLIHLGYAGLVRKNGDTAPKNALDQALYDYEFKAYSFAEHLMAGFSNLTVIRPEIYDVDSSNFELSREGKQDMVLRAMTNTRAQWAALPRF
jgi:hypothetical protein